MRPEAASKPRVRLVSVPCTGMDGNAGFKKLHGNLAADVDRAVEVIAADPGQEIARRVTCRNSMPTGSISSTSCTFWAKLAVKVKADLSRCHWPARELLSQLQKLTDRSIHPMALFESTRWQVEEDLACIFLE